MVRFARQRILPDFGEAGQGRLSHAQVLVVGVGGLGCPAAQSLAAMGVGRLGLVDFDRVELSNIHRQLLFGANDVGAFKSECAAEKLRSMYPEVEVAPVVAKLDASNAAELIKRFDVVVDCTDQMSARKALNFACVQVGKPLVSAAVQGFEGQLTVFAAGAPCLACVYPENVQPPSCAQVGVMGALPNILGHLQALEVVKIVANMGEPLIGRMLMWDGLSARSYEFATQKRVDCPACGAIKPHKPVLRRRVFACGDQCAATPIA